MDFISDDHEQPVANGINKLREYLALADTCIVFHTLDQRKSSS